MSLECWTCCLQFYCVQMCCIVNGKISHTSITSYAFACQCRHRLTCLSVIPKSIINYLKTILTEMLIIISLNLDFNLQNNSIKIDILHNFQQPDLMHCRVLIIYFLFHFLLNIFFQLIFSLNIPNSLCCVARYKKNHDLKKNCGTNNTVKYNVIMFMFTSKCTSILYPNSLLQLSLGIIICEFYSRPLPTTLSSINATVLLLFDDYTVNISVE